MQDGAWCPRSREDVGLIVGQTAGQRDLVRGIGRPRGAIGTKGGRGKNQSGDLARCLYPLKILQNIL